MTLESLAASLNAECERLMRSNAMLTEIIHKEQTELRSARKVVEAARELRWIHTEVRTESDLERRFPELWDQAETLDATLSAYEALLAPPHPTIVAREPVPPTP